MPRARDADDDDRKNDTISIGKNFSPSNACFPADNIFHKISNRNINIRYSCMTNMKQMMKMSKKPSRSRKKTPEHAIAGSKLYARSDENVFKKEWFAAYKVTVYTGYCSATTA